MDPLLRLLALAFIVFVAAWTVTQEEIFRELREWLARHASQNPRLLIRKVAYLPTCYYCFGFWVSVVVFAFAGVTLFSHWSGWIAGFALMFFAAQMYLTLFHLFRAWLRGMRNWADQLEHQAEQAGLEKHQIGLDIQHKYGPAGWERIRK